MKYPYEDAVTELTKGAINGAGSFLKAICLPAAEEFGLLIRDRISFWRTINAVKITQKAQKMLCNLDLTNRSAPPRIIIETIEKGSWASEDYIQNYWAGLLASSVTINGDDDSNLLFIDLLGRMTKVQIIILNYACENCTKYHSSCGWIFPGGINLTLEELINLTKVDDVHRLDRELDALREIGLIESGFNPLNTDADITPSSLALQMYVRCQGYVGSPTDYFHTTEADPEQVSLKWIKEKEKRKSELKAGA